MKFHFQLRRADTKVKLWDEEKAGGSSTYHLTGRMAGKESDKAIVRTFRRIQSEIDNMKDTEITRVYGKKVVIKHVVVTSMLDGKCR